MAEHKIGLDGLSERATELAAQGKTPMYVALDEQPAGMVAAADTFKPESAEAVRELQALGLEVWMLTGNNERPARATAERVGINNVMAKVLPEQKVAKVKELQAHSKVVAMGVLDPFFGLLLNPIMAAAAMAMSSVSVVTNSLRLWGFTPPKGADEIVHTPLRRRLADVSYRLAIGLVALAVGAVSLFVLRPAVGKSTMPGMDTNQGAGAPGAQARPAAMPGMGNLGDIGGTSMAGSNSLALINTALIVWFALTALSVAYVAWDAFTKNPELKVMRWGWILVTLYTGPVGAALYVLSCKEPRPGEHERFITPLWKQGLGSTIHCMAGDATGIIVAAAITMTLGLPMWLDVISEYVFGFAFGLLIFQSIFMKDMLGGSYPAAVKRSFMPEWLSMNAVMTGMVPTMVILMSRDMTAMEATSIHFWGVMSLATLVGLVLAFPLNVWLVASGLKHGMGTERVLAKGGHSLAAETAVIAGTSHETPAPNAEPARAEQSAQSAQSAQAAGVGTPAVHTMHSAAETASAQTSEHNMTSAKGM